MNRKNRDLGCIVVTLAVCSGLAVAENGFWRALDLRLQMANGITLRTGDTSGQFGKLTIHGSRYTWSYDQSSSVSSPSCSTAYRWTSLGFKKRLYGFTITQTAGTVTFAGGCLTLHDNGPGKRDLSFNLQLNDDGGARFVLESGDGELAGPIPPGSH